MGDKIRLQMEAMLPEMLVFVKRQIFSKNEINFIMKEREANEYLLERKNASVKDYLKVIEYEYGLEKQRRKRFKALKIKKESPKDFASNLEKRMCIILRLKFSYFSMEQLLKGSFNFGTRSLTEIDIELIFGNSICRSATSLNQRKHTLKLCQLLCDSILTVLICGFLLRIMRVK